MKRMLQAGFGEPIGQANIDLIKSLNFDGIRIDCQKVDSNDLMQQLITEVSGNGLFCLVIISDVKQLNLLPKSSFLFDLELLNEPDLHMQPKEYKAKASDLINGVKGTAFSPYLGAISSLKMKSISWLNFALPLNEDFRISLHHYPVDGTFETAVDGIPNRDLEVESFRNLFSGRRFGVSEFGYHSLLKVPSKNFFKRLFCIEETISEKQVLEDVEKEWDFWAGWGADFATLYQLNDGPNYQTSYEDAYGIRKFDGTLKKVATSIT